MEKRKILVPALCIGVIAAVVAGLAVGIGTVLADGSGPVEQRNVISSTQMEPHNPTSLRHDCFIVDLMSHLTGIDCHI